MGEVEYYQRLEKILRDFVLHRVHLHTDGEGWLTDYPMTYAEVDRMMRDLDEVRFEEKGTEKARETGEDAGGKLAEYCDECEKNTKQAVLENLDQVVSLMMLTPHLRRIEAALKKSAAADLVRAIIECEIYIEANVADIDVEAKIEYLDELKRQYADIIEPEKD